MKKLNAPEVMKKLRAPGSLKKLRTPGSLKKLRAPSVRSSRRASPSMPSVKAPAFLNNLYRDMRDRKLLLPALALVVALLAVPVVLSSSSTTTAPTSAAPAGASSAQESPTSPAVLAEQLGVTDYRKRLNELSSKNPFRRQFVSPPEAGKADSDQTSAPSSTATDTGTSTATTTSPSTSATSTSTTSSSGSPSTTPVQPAEPTLYAFRADVGIGVPGDVKRRKSVQLGTLLPGEGKPMVAFTGATEDRKHALFLITDDVSSVTGDGRCLPGRSDCKLLRMKVGDEAELTYAPEGDRVYKLKLHGISLAPVQTDGSGKRGGGASPSAVAAQG
jgi:hypothetical protein